MARVQNYNMMGILQNSLDASSLRHKILSDNVANIDTPGFKRSDISFKDELRRALYGGPQIQMDQNSERHFETKPSRDPAKITAKAILDSATWARNDKNNVNPEVENTYLAENTLYYQALARETAGAFQGLRRIIQSTPQG